MIMDVEPLSIREQLLRIAGHTRLPGTHRLVHSLAPHYPHSHAFSSKLFALDYVGDMSDMIDRTIFYFGAYAPGEIYFLQHCARRLASKSRNVNYFDVGANVGQHSLCVSGLVTTVHAFEPSSRIADRFAHNISINNLKNIFVHRVALGDSDGHADLGSGFPGNTGSRSLNWSLPGGATEQVVVRAAAAYLDEHSLPTMNILKLDVEGHERKVVCGLGARLISDRPVIMMELIGRDQKGGFASLDEFRRALYPDHELRSLIEHRDGYRLVPFDWDNECAIVVPAEMATTIFE